MAKKPILVQCSGTLPLNKTFGKVMYDVRKDFTIIAGNLEGQLSGVTIDIRLLKEAVDIALKRFCPGAGKKKPCIGNIWIDCTHRNDFPVIVIAGELDKCKKRQCVVMATVLNPE